MNFGFSLVLRITGTPASAAIERRRLAISSRLAAEGCADEKLKCHALFFWRYSSARDTRSIIRSYDPLAVDVANALLALRRIGHREHGVGMRVIDVRMRQDGVKDGFDGRRGRAGAQHVGIELVHHLRIWQAAQPCQPAHVPERERREAGRLD